MRSSITKTNYPTATEVSATWRNYRWDSERRSGKRFVDPKSTRHLTASSRKPSQRNRNRWESKKLGIFKPNSCLAGEKAQETRKENSGTVRMLYNIRKGGRHGRRSLRVSAGEGSEWAKQVMVFCRYRGTMKSREGDKGTLKWPPSFVGFYQMTIVSSGIRKGISPNRFLSIFLYSFNKII